MTLPGVQLAPPSLINPSPNSGQVIPIASWPREPLPTDVKYPIGFVVVIGKNPLTGTQGDLWYLSKFTAGAAIWKQFSTGPGAPGIDGIVTDDGLPAVLPDVNGNVSFLGDGVFIKTSGQGPGSTVNLEPVAPFLLGVNVDTSSGSGTDPVIPTSAGIINITGGQVANGTIANVIRTASLAANTFSIQIQRSATNATSDPTKNGVVHFSPLNMSVDGNGFAEFITPIAAWTPTILGGTVPGATTYTVQSGSYSRWGNLVHIQCSISWTATTGTGDLILTGFPYLFGGAQPRAPICVVWPDNMTWPAGTAYFVGLGQDATTQMVFEGVRDGAVSQHLQMQATGTIEMTMVYFTASPP